MLKLGKFFGLANAVHFPVLNFDILALAGWRLGWPTANEYLGCALTFKERRVRKENRICQLNLKKILF